MRLENGADGRESTKDCKGRHRIRFQKIQLEQLRQHVGPICGLMFFYRSLSNIIAGVAAGYIFLLDLSERVVFTARKKHMGCHSSVTNLNWSIGPRDRMNCAAFFAIFGS